MNMHENSTESDRDGFRLPEYCWKCGHPVTHSRSDICENCHTPLTIVPRGARGLFGYGGWTIFLVIIIALLFVVRCAV